MKSRQYCSVCKDWLDMEVVPTGDGDDDDGVIWFRCPQCQGFLPKLSGADLQGDESGGGADDAAQDSGDDMTTPAARGGAAGGDQDQAAPAGTGAAGVSGQATAAAEDDLPWDSPAAMMAARAAARGTGDEFGAVGTDGPRATLDDESDDESDDEMDGGSDDGSDDAADDEKAAPEPIHEYAAMLAGLDPETAMPYRPWETYEVGQCVLHLAWEDCGVVVAKEDLPGGRKVIKCYFEDAGVVRLIEQAPR
ncbi:hypothetical protein KDM41_01670 [bacterium]|nr:hypothetical protein [bacterium]